MRPLLLALATLAAACDPTDVSVAIGDDLVADDVALDLPPLPEAPCDGGTLLVVSSGWECVDDFWSFVDRATWRCPDGTLQDVVQVTPSEDPCGPPPAAEAPEVHVDPDPGDGDGLPDDAELPPLPGPPCEGGVPVPGGATFAWECVDGLWSFVDRVRYQCPDGTEVVAVQVTPTDSPCEPPPEPTPAPETSPGPPPLPRPPCPGGRMVDVSSTWECIDGFWNFVDRVTFVCPDGSTHVVTQHTPTREACTPGR